MFLKLKKQNNSKNETNIIFLIAGICVVLIPFLFLQYSLAKTKEYISSRLNDKAISAESILNSKIADAKHIIYGLGVTISEKTIISNRDKLIKLIQNFDQKHKFDEEFTIPLTDIVFIPADGVDIIHATKFNNHNRIYNKNSFDIKLCLQEKEAEFFKVKISPLRIDSATKEIIMPINMSISDSNNKFLGTLCSGLIVRELNKMLNLYFDSRYLNSIAIVNHDSKNKVIKSHSIIEILKSNFSDQNIFSQYELKNYPFLFEIKLTYSFLTNTIYIFALFLLSIFILFILTMYLIVKRMRNYYENPLKISHKKLMALKQFITDKDKTLLSKSNDLPETYFSPTQFSKSVNNLIDEYYTSFLEYLAHSTEHQEIQKKFLNLIFIEQHFRSLQKTKISEEEIYLNKFYNLINEEFITRPIGGFLKQLIAYCSEFYYEITIKSIIVGEGKQNFTFKKAALIEAIFSILTLILRSAIYDEEVFIKAEFIGNNDFPTITIEAYFIETSDCNNLGWETGPYYAHTSLLAIYLLAKENKLFLNIIKKENTVYFVLEPITKKMEFYNLAISELK